MKICDVEDFNDPSLAASVEDAGGYINLSGWYPLNDTAISTIKYALRGPDSR